MVMKVYRYRINGNDYQVIISPEGINKFKVEVNGEEYLVEVTTGAPKHITETQVLKEPKQIQKEDIALVVKHQPSIGVEEAGEFKIKAPIPGLVLKVLVKPGDIVAEGDIVAVIESMKMENNIIATTKGIVKEVLVKPDDTVKLNQVLMVLGATKE